MIWWWTCVRCWDRMDTTADREQVARDRDAHLLNTHPGWQPTERELNICHWP